MTPVLAAAANQLAAQAMVAADDITSNPVSGFVPYLNLGVIVLLVIMVITGKGVVPSRELDNLEKAHDQATNDLKAAHERELRALTERAEAAEAREEEYKRLNADLQTYQRDQLQPALIETTRVVSAYVAALARRGDV